MRIISTARNSSFSSDGWRHYAEVVIETDDGERQYVFGTIGSMELWSIFRTSGVDWYINGDSWCDEDPYLNSVRDFISIKQAKRNKTYGEYFKMVEALLDEKKASCLKEC